MRGKHVIRRGGWDTHGLPVELEIEKELGLKSKQEIEADGYVDFSTLHTADAVACGLSVGDTNQTLTDIDFAINLNGAVNIRVYEGGALKFTYAVVFVPGDRARVILQPGSNEGGFAVAGRCGNQGHFPPENQAWASGTLDL